MSHNAVILHGTMGSPDGNWFPWLKEQLEADGYDVFIPALPTPEGQTAQNWQATILPQTPPPDDKTILIGHSCGATHLLHVLESLEKPVAHAIFVSVVMDKINIPEYDRLNDSFIHHDFNWDKIRKNADKVTIFHGDDDPYVPLAQAQTLSDHLGTPVTIIKNGGHLNAESGFTAFDALYNCI